MDWTPAVIGKRRRIISRRVFDEPVAKLPVVKLYEHIVPEHHTGT